MSDSQLCYVCGAKAEGIFFGKALCGFCAPHVALVRSIGGAEHFEKNLEAILKSQKEELDKRRAKGGYE